MTTDTVSFPRVAWQELERAAEESTWLPLGYRPEKWATDVCTWLRDGPRSVLADAALIETLRQITPLAADYLRLTGGGKTNGCDQEIVRRAANLLHAAAIPVLRK